MRRFLHLRNCNIKHTLYPYCTDTGLAKDMNENQFRLFNFVLKMRRLRDSLPLARVEIFSPTPPNLYQQGGGASHLPHDNETEKPPLVELKNLFSRSMD